MTAMYRTLHWNMHKSFCKITLILLVTLYPRVFSILFLNTFHGTIKIIPYIPNDYNVIWQHGRRHGRKKKNAKFYTFQVSNQMTNLVYNYNFS